MKNLNDMSDEELAMSYIGGNSEAFDLLLSHNQQRVFNYILFVVHDRDIADDLFQETFIKVITKLQEGKYVSSGKFSAWVIRVAHNIVIDWFRSKKANKVVDGPQENNLQNLSNQEMMISNIEAQMVASQTLKDIRSLMNRLPTSQREVIYMRFYQDLSFKEIAEISGVSINTSLGRMRYALLNLRKMMTKYDIQL